MLLSDGSNPNAGHPGEILALSFAIGVPISAIAMYLFAMPVLMLFRERGLLGYPTLCAVTTLIGALILPGSLSLFMGGHFDPWLMAWGAGCGLGAGVIFGLVAGVPWRPTPT